MRFKEEGDRVMSLALAEHENAAEEPAEGAAPEEVPAVPAPGKEQTPAPEA